MTGYLLARATVATACLAAVTHAVQKTLPASRLVLESTLETLVRN
jgi:hypothetical protein